MLRGRERWRLPCDELWETIQLPLPDLAPRLDVFAEAVEPVVDELPDGATLASILAGLIAKAIEERDRRSNIRLYQILISDGRWHFDTRVKLLPLLRQENLLEDPRTYAYFFRMLLTTPDAEPANFCLYMLHHTAQAPPLEVARLFAMHDKFIGYASRMIPDRYEEAEDVLIELAKVDDGWQRVHILDHLHVVAKPENRAWLLQEGYINGVCEAYTLYKTAVAGDLIGRLRAGGLTLKELLHAGAILRGLTDYTLGPRDCWYLYDYEDGPEACSLFIGFCENQPRHEGLYFRVEGLVKFMAEDCFDEEPERAALWPAGVRQDIARCGREYLDRPDWPRELIHRFSETADPDAPSVRWLAGGDLTCFPELVEVADDPGIDSGADCLGRDLPGSVRVRLAAAGAALEAAGDAHERRLGCVAGFGLWSGCAGDATALGEGAGRGVGDYPGGSRERRPVSPVGRGGGALQMAGPVADAGDPHLARGGIRGVLRPGRNLGHRRVAVALPAVTFGPLHA